MRNGGCVAGHSVGVAFHQSGGAGAPAASLRLSMQIFQEHTTGRLPTGSHTRYRAHTLRRRRACGRGSAHKRTGRQPITCMVTWLNSHS